ncbi:hypothetical protein [Endozoicomonas euniceicola]|uniref:Isochorismatase-like domain-containing protein n=1 Tax=Endozoicomonas euniceicola TaxID=1234143 RepID=A0ABY6GY46_9GAMM|nr:hypothetical protein [Endozoicomonas euniceicola]UYM17718.1 hypothetical protein NX720_07365 [Endozoicomonas euniceicola]
MSVISGSLIDGIIQFHDPENRAKTAAIVIDEKDCPCISETFRNSVTRKKSQQVVLRFCKDLGCEIIVVYEREVLEALHIYSIIGSPDFSCIKQAEGVLASSTTPSLMTYMKQHHITSLVVMGSYSSFCIKESLIGGWDDEQYYPGLLNKKITVLSSPALIGPYHPEAYRLKPKFSSSATSHEFLKPLSRLNKDWPVFTLHPGMRFYTKIR